METSEILKKVRTIELKTRGLSSNIFAGEYHSAFKGRGMTFSEVREYQYGDSVKDIDWNVTARYNKPFIKTFEEERELTVMLLVDVSGSKIFGTHTKSKQALMAEIAAVISFSAGLNNDKVGVIFFSDRVEKFIPPKKGKGHILRIIREIIDFEPESKKTDITEALKFFTNAMKKRCISFLLSDFYAPNFKDAIKIANQKHDLIALNIYDIREKELPNVGLLKLKDAETDEEVWINSSSKKTRKIFEQNWLQKQKELDECFKQANVDYTSISTQDDYVKSMLTIFKKR